MTKKPKPARSGSRKALEEKLEKAEAMIAELRSAVDADNLSLVAENTALREQMESERDRADQMEQVARSLGWNGSDAPEGSSVWPDWYTALYAIPGFKVPLPKCQSWLDKRGIGEDRAEEVAYAVKSKWPGPKSRPYTDPWATFQNWAKRAPLTTKDKPLHERVMDMDKNLPPLREVEEL